MALQFDEIAGIDNENQIRIECEVQGLYKSLTYGAIVDTGFSGGLVLPLVVAVDLGLTKAGAASVTLADGSSQTLPMFMCKVKIKGKVLPADTLVMGTDVLIGMGLLDEFRLCFSTKSGKVTLDEEQGMVRFAKLTEQLRQLTSRT